MTPKESFINSLRLELSSVLIILANKSHLTEDDVKYWQKYKSFIEDRLIEAIILTNDKDSDVS